MNERHLASLVTQYQTSIHPRLSQELAFYQQSPTIDTSIEYAALAKLPNGKRHPHQRRLKRQVSASVQQHLLQTSICSSLLLAGIRTQTARIVYPARNPYYSTHH
jgi:hypothetical protein